MIFTRFPYVVTPSLTNCLESDVQAFLEANGRPKTLAHVQFVDSSPSNMGLTRAGAALLVCSMTPVPLSSPLICCTM